MRSRAMRELAALMEQGGAGNLTLGLAGALYQEVAAESREFVRQSLIGRHEVTQKFMRPVRAIREKLAGLAFLDPGIAPLVGSIDEVLAAVPGKGKITVLARGATRCRDPADRPGQDARARQMMLEGSSKGLLADPEPIQEVVSRRRSRTRARRARGATLVPPAQPARGQRVSAFW